MNNSLLSKPLHKKVALITGSTSGIGKGIAESLANHGCDVIINGFGDQEEIKKLCADIAMTYSVRAEFVGADLSKVPEIEDLHEAILKLFPEGLDILVNNAGIQHLSPVESFPVEKWDFMISLMLSAPFHLTRLFLPYMKQKGWGRIINISSAHGHVASPNKCAYVSAKHGLIGLTKTVAVEVAGSGVTCNAICPGYVETPLFLKQAADRSKDQGISFEQAKSQIVGIHSSKEPVKIEQVGEIAAFLCSPAADQILGTSIMVDGGWTIK
ncbi:D-beta-hydroxybutyrate dehydrogenase-like isoform X2 [Gigantopelta aegis]|uniref:D-beta-hydroxybutyrate dehydrogenase-like isoform X2 n=1 Tax=Gigantopelta aegis TaxID=1735272 RepID=UPI001B88E33A|nr:D-beta-hydroxybutyrate dehydrogenase-like isoform X2 [Gigantopelta aegis]